MEIWKLILDVKEWRLLVMLMVLRFREIHAQSNYDDAPPLLKKAGVSMLSMDFIKTEHTSWTRDEMFIQVMLCECYKLASPVRMEAVLSRHARSNVTSYPRKKGVAIARLTRMVNHSHVMGMVVDDWAVHLGA